MSYLTLTDISNHFLNEVIRADNDFQRRQEEAWNRFEANPPISMGFELSQGFRKMESMFLSEIKYDFLLVAISEPFLQRCKRWFGFGLKGEVYFKLKKLEKETESTRVTFQIQRKTLGKYITEITATPPLPRANDQIHVIDFTR